MNRYLTSRMMLTASEPGMKLPRFSIKKLMAIVAMVAVVVAALARPNYGWAHLLSVIYVVILLAAPLGAILRRGPRQARWIGFGVFGWAFFLYAKSRGEDLPFAPVRFNNMGITYGIDAPSTNLLVLFMSVFSSLSRLHDDPDWFFPLVSFADATQIDGFSSAVVVVSVMGLAFALLGGQIARFLARGGPFDPPPITPA